MRLSASSPHVLNTFASILETLGDDDLHWNALLLISHGAQRQREGDADPVRFGEIPAAGRTPGTWWLVNGGEMNLEDKLVSLAVCYGAGEEASEVALEHQLALTLTGPRTKLSAPEVLAFFLPVFEALAAAPVIEAETIAAEVVARNALAGGKMVTLMPGAQ